MRKRAIGACVGCAILAGSLPARAADRTDWSGFYLGVNAGAGWGESKFRSIDNVPLFPGFTVPSLGNLVVPASNGNVATTKGNDVNALGGGQFGFNRQAGRVVFGAEADYDGTRLGTNAVGKATATPVSHTGYQTLNAKYFTDANWMGSLRGRIGFVQDFLMVYATGGVAFAHVSRVDTSFVEVNGQNVIPAGAVSILTTTDNHSKIHTGWTIGAGGEWAINTAWSVAAEYRFSDVGYQTYDAGIANAAFASSPRLSANMKLTIDQVTIRLNYRFGA